MLSEYLPGKCAYLPFSNISRKGPGEKKKKEKEKPFPLALFTGVGGGGLPGTTHYH